MPGYSIRSDAYLSTCDWKLQTLFNKVIVRFDCTILCGYRGELVQNEYFRLGLSDKEYPNSEHNLIPSRAVDVAPYPINWEDTYRFHYFAGYVKGIAQTLDIPIIWGGDWDDDTEVFDNLFDDLCHFELMGGLND